MNETQNRITPEDPTLDNKDAVDINRKSNTAGMTGWILFFAVCVVVFVVIGTFIIPSIYFLRFCPLILELSGLIGIGLGLWDLILMKRVNLKISRRILTDFIVIIFSVLIFSSGILAQRLFEIATLMGCGSNMSNVSSALRHYAENNNWQYPDAQKWCDLLIEKEDVYRRQFRCPGPWTGSCHYAINPACKLNSPADTVLLFETKGGWNQHGVSELLTFKNHRGKNAYVLFNDGHAKLIQSGDIGKLKWKAEDVNNSN